MALCGTSVGKGSLEAEVIRIPEHELKSRILDSWEEWSVRGPKPHDLSFIFRLSTWLGEKGKVILYIFRRSERLPVLIGKTVRDVHFGDTIREEAHSMFRVWEEVSTVMRGAVPRPVALEEIDGFPIYLEEAIPGTSLPDWVMQRWGKRKQYMLLARAVSEAAKWLWDFESCIGIEDAKLTSQEIQGWFIAPVEAFRERVVLDSNEQAMLNQLEEFFWGWEGHHIPLVAGHGDFWGGSLLWSDSGLGVIDWEFFQPRSLPLFDLFMLAVHPGVAIGKSGWELVDEFSMCFEDNAFSRQVRIALSAFCQRLGLTVEITRSLFLLFLIYLSNSRDKTIHEEKSQSGKTWYSLFKYYVQRRKQLYILA